jgi:DNA-binding protein YbaB
LEIKTCEEYVLAELEKTEKELEAAKAEIEKNRATIEYADGVINILKQCARIVKRYVAPKAEEGTKETIESKVVWVLEPAIEAATLNLEERNEFELFKTLVPLIGDADAKAELDKFRAAYMAKVAEAAAAAKKESESKEEKED